MTPTERSDYMRQWRENLRAKIGSPEWAVSSVLQLTFVALIGISFDYAANAIAQRGFPLSVDAWYFRWPTAFVAVLLAFRVVPHKPITLCYDNISNMLALFLPGDITDGFFGDLNERFEMESARLGKAAAERWYRRQLIKSIPPLLGLVIRHAMSKAIRSAVK